MYVDRIPVITSSESSISVSDSVSDNVGQCADLLDVSIPEGVVHMSPVLSRVHQRSEALTEPRIGRVYDMEEILRDIQVCDQGRPSRNRQIHDYKQLHCKGFKKE